MERDRRCQFRFTYLNMQVKPNLFLKKFIAPLIIGKEFSSIEDFVSSYSFLRGHNFAKTAVESAFWHLCSQKQGEPLWKLLGGTRTQVEVGESLGIPNSIDELLKEVAERLDQGYKRIKVKTRPGWDVKPIAAIRERFDTIPLMVDANSSYSLSHIDIFSELDKFDLTMIEQPLAYDDIVDHATLQHQIRTPICLDESILSVDDARKAIQIGACRVINIKPGRVGGLLESRRIHDLCVANNIGVRCGGMFETTIGRFFNLSIASLPGFVFPADMSPASLLFREELVMRPLEVANGAVCVPMSIDEFEVDEKLIRQCTVEHVVFVP